MVSCVAGIAIAALSLPVFGEECDHKQPRQLAANAAGATSVKVIGRAGWLKVEGVRGLSEVKASGTACTSSAKLLGATKLTAKRSGSEIIIEAEMPSDVDGSWLFGIGSDYARLDFTVQIPENLAVVVKDGSGELTIRNVASLRVSDGSGELTVDTVRGDATISDGSGELSVSNVAGTVRITDGSGAISLRGIGRDVIIEADGSGGIEVANVKGSVTVESDGSGGIDVVDVVGDFTVRRDGSGGIEFSSVRGQVRVPRD
jgi:hypothetical protein